MEKVIKNKIITLSGEPVAGKGTVTRELLAELQRQGYEEEKIHIISAGNEFREDFKSILRLIECLKNKDYDEAKKLSLEEDIQTILANPEYREELKRTATTLVKNNIDIKNLSIEEMNNLSELREIRKMLDLIIDSKIANIGKDINSEERPDEVWIIDSRLAFHNVPEAFSVRLTANPNVAAKRLLKDKTRGEEDNNYATIEEAREAREKRRIGEQKRYIARYNVDLSDPDNYDLIVDTSYANPKDIVKTILRIMQYHKEGKKFAKNWTSPKTLLPTQSERDTFSSSDYMFEDIQESIEKNGFFPNSPIEIAESEGYRAIVEGHHRNFAAALLGETLVPYEVIARDDETIPYSGDNAIQRINSINERILLGHAWIIAEGEKAKTGEESNFSYDEVYPEITKKIKEGKLVLSNEEREDR